MSVKTEIYAALSAVLPNTHAIELPKNPTWPAIVFEVVSEPEAMWCQGGGYDQHDISVILLALDLEEIEALRLLIEPAMSTITGYLADEDHGDADYEPDPNVYAYYMNFTARTRKG